MTRPKPNNQAIAAFLAKKVFARGLGPGNTIRISLRGGKLGTTPISEETDRGGLCEEALRDVLLEGLQELASRE